MLEFLNLLVAWWNLLVNATPEAAVQALVVLLSVVGLRLVSVLPNSKWARAANVVLSALLSGIVGGTTNSTEVTLFTMTALFAAGLWTLVEKLWIGYKGQKPFAAQNGG